ncbi:MAG: hypothetical protein MK138_03320, partial [Planctomycetes bacterium]|nr:hypothetical protein [Planctomycetota bacterium]
LLAQPVDLLDTEGSLNISVRVLFLEIISIIIGRQRVASPIGPAVGLRIEEELSAPERIDPPPSAWELPSALEARQENVIVVLDVMKLGIRGDRIRNSIMAQDE